MDSLLKEVDLLMSKIKSLPENEKQLAINKINERLSSKPLKSPPYVPSENLPASLGNDIAEEQTSAGNNDSALTHTHDSTSAELDEKDIEVFLGIEKGNKVDHNSVTTVLTIQLPSLQCDVCGVCYKTKGSLKKHLKTHKKTYTCNVCEKIFRTQSNLRVHRKRHANQRDFPCSECDYKSFTKIELDRHHSSAHNKSYVNICEHCGKMFSATRLLKSHIKAVHLKDESPTLRCSHCPYTTMLKGNLRVHVQLKHLRDYYTHVCPVCGAKVTLKSAFIEHLRAHTGDRPFQCDLCSSSFACRGRLNAHKRTIHNPRQFSCEICSKKFPTKHSLERHTSTHLNSKPNSCPFCQFACNMIGNLTKHIRNRHHMPNFSMRDFKRQQNVVVGKEKKSWTEKGEKEMGQYLSSLSEKLGREVTVQELKAQEHDKRKHLTAVVEKAKLDRINKLNFKEHSYFQKPAAPAVTTLPHVLPNIYAEAIAAANLDFSTTNITELPSLLTDSEEGFYVDTTGLILPAELPELRDPMLPTFTDMLALGLENYSLPVMDAQNCYVQLPSGEKVQVSLQDQLPMISHNEALHQNEFLAAPNTYMIVLAENNCEILPQDERHLLQ